MGGGRRCASSPVQVQRSGRTGPGLQQEALPHAFCAGLRARGGLRLIPRGPSRAERGGVGNLGKEVLIEDDGLRRVFLFLKLPSDEGGGIWCHSLPQRLFQGGFPHVKGLELLAVILVQL